MVTDFNLVCDEQFKVALVGTIYMCGLFFGSVLFGTMGDKIGRKLTLMFAITMGSTANLIEVFMPNYYLFCIARFFTAAGTNFKHCLKQFKK